MVSKKRITGYVLFTGFLKRALLRFRFLFCVCVCVCEFVRFLLPFFEKGFSCRPSLKGVKKIVTEYEYVRIAKNNGE